jgi:formate hydrogenlyase subunit 3/multisubunit Na+/H+ antiporter MnhD subunit
MAAISVTILMFLPVLIPFCVALLLFGIRKKITGFSGELSVGGMIMVISFIAALINRINLTSAKVIFGIYTTSSGSSYGAPTGVQFRSDLFSSWFMLFLNVIIVLLMIFELAIKRNQKDNPIFFAIFLFLVSGINGAFIAYDFITLFLSWVIIGLAAIGLVSFNQAKQSFDGIIRLYIMTGISLVLILLAAVLCFSVNGTFNFEILFSMGENAFTAGNTLILVHYFILALIIVGFGIFALVVLVNLWSITTMEKTPFIGKVLFSGITSSMAILSMFKVLYSIYRPNANSGFNYSIILVGIGLLTAFEGAILALGQILHKKDQLSISKIISYQAIANIGLIIVFFAFPGLLVDSADDLLLFAQKQTYGFSYLLLINLVATTFMAYTSNERLQTFFAARTNINRMKGLARKLPLTSFTLIVSLLSLIGFLPTFGGVLMTMQMFNLLLTPYLAVPILAAMVILLLLGSFMMVYKFLFFDEPEQIVTRGGLTDDLTLSSAVNFFVALFLLLLSIIPLILTNPISEGVLDLLI